MPASLCTFLAFFIDATRILSHASAYLHYYLWTRLVFQAILQIYCRWLLFKHMDKKRAKKGRSKPET